VAFGEQLFAKEAINDYFDHLRKKDGSEMIVTKNMQVVKVPDGTIPYFEGFVSDIIERKRVDVEVLYVRFPS